MLLFFSIIIFSGVLGGLIFALDSTHTHTLKVPWNGKEKNTGWLGHVIVGIGGSIVAISASIPIFNLNIEGFLISKFSDIKVALDLITYLLAIGILGGYSGLRIISGMSDAMMKKLTQTVEAKVQESTQGLREENQKVRDTLATNIRNDKELKRNVEKYKDDHDLVKGAFFTETGKADDAIEILLPQTQKHPKKHKAWMWLGSAYKKTKQYSKALDCSLTATELAPTEWSYSFNSACYSSLGEKDKEIIIKYLKETVKKFKADERYGDLELLTRLFKEDKDLEFIRNQYNIFNLLN